MRKIEQQITDAIRARRGFIGGNTAVTAVTAVSNPPHANDLLVQLHGNTIARLSGDRLTLDWCGWNTPTTRSRLNCVLRALVTEPLCAVIAHGKGIFINAETRAHFPQSTLTLQVQP